MNETKTPQDLLAQVRAHYQGLSSFSMQITHQDSSGLYPGRYTQRLQWQRGGRFELRNTSPQNKMLREDLSPVNNPRAVPDFVADGAQVVSVLPSGKRRTEQEGPQPNTMPGWEVTGGSVLSWLQDTPYGRLFLTPPPGTKGDWSVGPRTVWHGRKVRELLARWTSQGQTETSSYFLGPDSPTLVGFEWHTGWAGKGKVGYALYTNQKENPPLPATLGSAP